MWSTVVFLFVNLVIGASSYKILGVFPHWGKSHVDVYHPLMVGLAEKGHDVTMVSRYKYGKSSSKLKQLILDAPNLSESIDMSYLNGYRYEKYVNNLLLAYLGLETCDTAFGSAVIQDLINNDETYDIVIMEFFNTDCLAPLAYKLKASLIGLSSCTTMVWSNERFGNIYHPGYIPAGFLDYSDRMSFFERVENTATNIFFDFFFNYIVKANDNRLARLHFKDENLPSIDEIVRNSSLFLVNTHFALNLPRPVVPAVVEIGGIHVGKAKPLPQDLEKWISEAPHGVIYFSLGSMIRGHTFPENLRNEFLKAFARLPQRVLWKWENDSMPGQPDNVKIGKWMPQFDVLSHPNVRAFISHGGLLGTTEAVHCGVPVVVMPQYGDQHTNARALEANGGGVILQLREATEEKVYNALQKVLAPEFRKGAQELSARFRDRPLPPLETAIYWVEYVARHRGAHHMRTAAVDMPLYQYLLLDVFAFLALVALVLSLISFYVTRTVFRFVFKSKKPKVKTN